MTVQCTSIKNIEGKHHFELPKINLELLKTLILNFAYIHSSKRRKLGVFIIFQKCQFVHPKFATNSSIFFIFNGILILSSNPHLSYDTKEEEDDADNEEHEREVEEKEAPRQ